LSVYQHITSPDGKIPKLQRQDSVSLVCPVSDVIVPNENQFVGVIGMRQGFRVLVFGMVILVAGGLAFADQVAVGAISYDPFILGQPGLPAVNVFDLSNLTGINSFPPDFPVVTNLDFNNLTLTVFDSGGGQQSFDGGTVSPGFATLDAQFLDTMGINSAILTGSFSVTAISPLHPFNFSSSEESVPITVFQTQMRHANVKSTLRVYAHIIPQSQRDAMERASMAIGTNVPIGTEVKS
jgi:hypothetical protein